MSGATVKHVTEVRAAGERLTAVELLAWLREFPTELAGEVELEEITENRGHQRDPYSVLVGMRARWEGPL